MGGWRNQGERCLGEPWGATPWTLHTKKNSKKPFERSSVREKKEKEQKDSKDHATSVEYSDTVLTTVGPQENKDVEHT